MDQNPPKESRPPINLRIKFRSESVEQFIERYAVDVSRGGIFIRTREPLAVGTQLKLDFQFQNGTALMAGDGTVVWIREFDANRTNVPPGMGVRFDKLTPESQAVLEQLLVEKAKRERSGVPGSSNQGGGGMAVRRPSSMFSVLDPQGPGAGPSAPTAPTTAAPAAPGASSEAPSGPLAAVAAQLGSGSRSGPQPLPGPTAAGPSGAAPGATGTPGAAASGEQTEKGDAPAYRPLGTARNPFSSVGPLPPSDGNSGDSSTGTATTTAVVTGAENRNKPALEKLSGAADSPAESSEDSAAPFGDINDEPTQIAGRLPSFLLSDEEATVTAGQVPKVSSEAAQSTASTTADPGKATSLAGADKAAADDSASGSRRPLPGMGRVDKADKRDKNDKNDIKEKNDKHSDKLSSSPTEAGSDTKAGDGPRLSLLVPGAASTGGSAAGTPSASSATGAADQTGEKLAASASSPPSSASDARVTSSTTPVVPSPPAAAGVENRRTGALWIGVMVVVLGAAGIFLFRFFSARTTDTGPAMGTNAASISGAPPTSGEPAPAAPAAVEPIPPPAAAAPADGAAGSAVDPTPPGAPSGAVPIGQGAPAQGSAPAASAAAEGAGPRGGSADSTAQVAGAIPETGAAGPTRRTKLKGGRAARQSGATGDTAAVPGAAEPRSADPKGEKKPADPRPADTGATPPGSSGGAVIAAPAATTVAAGPPAATAGNASPPGEPASDGPTHQIRVTSKPDGAEVVLDGQTVGKTPFTVGIADVSAPHFIAVRKEGFEAYEQMFSASSGWSKGKPAKGKTGAGAPGMKVLKINAKLKPLAGSQVKTTTDPAAPVNPSSPSEGATKGQPQPIRPDRPIAPAPSDERPATENSP